MERSSGAQSWFTTTELLRWYKEIFRCAAPEGDPYLTMLGPADKESVRAGLALFAAATHGRAGEQQAAAAAATEFRALAPYDVEIVFERELARALR